MLAFLKLNFGVKDSIITFLFYITASCTLGFIELLLNN